MPVFSRTFRSLLAVAALLLAATTALAQSFPSKPVRILVPYAAGGAVDVLARTLGQSLSKTWGQQPVIENRPGAGGIMHRRRSRNPRPMAHADPGRERPSAEPVLLSETAQRHLQGIHRHQRDRLFAARDRGVEEQPGEKSAGVADERARKAGGIVLRHVRNGTSAHLAGELLNYMAKVKILAIPYKGGASALTAAIAGEIPMSVNPLPEVVGQLKATRCAPLP